MTDDRSFAATLSKLPSFDEFRKGTSILRRVHDIHKFSFTVWYQKSGAITAPGAQEALISDGYAVLNDLLVTTGIHYLHSLEAMPSTPSADRERDSKAPILEFQFDHDTQHCQFQFFEDRFLIVRRASSLADFYMWY